MLRSLVRRTVLAGARETQAEFYFKYVMPFSDLQLRTTPPLIILDSVRHAGNVASVLRNCSLFGFKLVVLSLPEAPSKTFLRNCIRHTCVKAHADAEAPSFHLVIDSPPVPELLADLRGRGYQVVGLHPVGGEALWTALGAASGYQNQGSRPLAIVAGAEREGLSPAAVASCTHLASIPAVEPSGVFNVSIAVEVACYEAFRQASFMPFVEVR
ncbi:unnamed protein product [Polarella glacialis]|uniref:tRNA/rRNA methyltransferase SpoU type domain-containing protein n=1 Tax=Polarella glacialis TaxID=89957 RepID=A0A813K3M1_POLGL|nr:unnamed protein product [Polarella glacialis]CAE8696118.1 unnamed protein product [Polarella glacialis]